MSNLEAAKKIAELLNIIANKFLIETKDVKLDVCEEGVGLLFKVNQHTSNLMVFDSVQFEQLCEEMDLEGIIFFRPQGIVEFVMNPKPIQQVNKDVEFVSGNPGDFSVKEQGFIIADQYDDEIG